MDRIAGLGRLAMHLADVAPADLSLRLWDGTILPLAPGARQELLVLINTPAALTRLLRRPRLTTLIDFAARLDGGSTRGQFKRLRKGLLASTLLPFLFGPGGGSATTAHAGRQAARAAVSRRQGASAVPLRPVQCLLRALMACSCGYLPGSEADLASAQQARLEMICRKPHLAPGERFLDIGCGWGGSSATRRNTTASPRMAQPGAVRFRAGKDRAPGIA